MKTLAMFVIFVMLLYAIAALLVSISCSPEPDLDGSWIPEYINKNKNTDENAND
jgi:hypothetical protein